MKDEERKKDMRIQNHPILGDRESAPMVSFTFDGERYQGRAGEPVAAALYAAGIRVHSYSVKHKKPRGIFCMIGKCTDCIMVIDGEPNTRSCVTLLEEGMDIQTQVGNHSAGQTKKPGESS